MEQPTAEEIGKWHRWYAMEANNRAWTLTEKSEHTAAEQEEMLDAAHAAAFHWSKVGTELHRVRAGMLLGLVCALLGDGAAALVHARRSHDYVIAHESPDWEAALAHAVLAHAAHAAKEAELFAEQYAKARSAGETIADPEDKEIFQRTFARLPVPPVTGAE